MENLSKNSIVEKPKENVFPNLKKNLKEILKPIKTKQSSSSSTSSNEDETPKIKNNTISMNVDKKEPIEDNKRKISALLSPAVFYKEASKDDDFKKGTSIKCYNQNL